MERKERASEFGETSSHRKVFHMQGFNQGGHLHEQAETSEGVQGLIKTSSYEGESSVHSSHHLGKAQAVTPGDGLQSLAEL